ncbi:hypothetical protein GN956_G4049 [Arapaima gigas]
MHLRKTLTQSSPSSSQFRLFLPQTQQPVSLSSRSDSEPRTSHCDTRSLDPPTSKPAPGMRRRQVPSKPLHWPSKYQNDIMLVGEEMLQRRSLCVLHHWAFAGSPGNLTAGRLSKLTL